MAVRPRIVGKSKHDPLPFPTSLLVRSESSTLFGLRI
jgi:hypothetical protein